MELKRDRPGNYPAPPEQLLPYLRRLADSGLGPGCVHFIFSWHGMQMLPESMCLLRFVYYENAAQPLKLRASFDGAQEDRVIRTGDLLVCGYNGWFKNDIAVKGNDVSAFTLTIHPGFVRFIQNNFVDGINYGIFYHAERPKDNVTSAIISAIQNLMVRTESSRTYRIQPLVTALCRDLLPLLEPPEPATEPLEPDNRMLQLRKYLETNFPRPINCTEAATVMGLNRSRASTQFRQCFGESMNDFLFRLRMTEAAELLLSSNCRIEEAGRCCSYVNPSYFIRSFKKFYGMTPREYRLKHQ